MNAIVQLQGRTFSRLTVTARAGSDKRGKALWECKCICGKISIVAGANLRNGHTVSCGCYRTENNRLGVSDEERARRSIAGRAFGHLTVLCATNRRTRNRLIYWLCRCDCGREVEINGNVLRNGNATRCRSCVSADANVRHGDTRFLAANKRLYRIWAGMKARCKDLNSKNRRRYFDRGIKVCVEWTESYLVFRDWALANGYHGDLTIDRWPDQNGNYEPGNCRWATCQEQNRNRHDNRLIIGFGETKTIAEWSQDPHCSITPKALYARIERGWTHEVAITTPKLPSSYPKTSLTQLKRPAGQKKRLYD